MKQHLGSLPERYALSVDPEEALTHMVLIADITSDMASSGTSSAVPTPRTVRVLVKPCGGGGGGGGGRNVSEGRQRCTVTVACRQSPLLLGAASSSLRFSGGMFCVFGVAEEEEEGNCVSFCVGGKD